MNASFWKRNSNSSVITASSSEEQKHMLSALKGMWGPLSSTTETSLQTQVSKVCAQDYVL